MAETDGGERSASLWRLRLTVRSGPDAGKSCTVDRDVVTVGKLPGCDLVLADPTVSRRHFSICRAEDGRWRLVDLGSTNGTFIDGTRVREAPIEAGRVLVAGKVEIVFLPEQQSVAWSPWPDDRLGPLVGRSLVMRRLFGLLARVAPTDATVLIQGETGTGKGLVARAIRDASLRRDGPHVVVDCGSVQRQLVESELFGHEKGAFSGAHERRIGAFELANRGTIFIDELGELDLELQPKLLRALDAREIRRLGATEPTPVDIRVIAASRRNLAREVERGAFREDLYFRLSVVTVDVPPLRERPEDIALLVDHFLREIADERGVVPPRLDGATLDRLTSHDWPGNVRELKNTIERAVLLAALRPGGRLEVAELESVREVREDARSEPRMTGFDPSASYSEAKDRWMDAKERAYVSELLACAEGNVSRAARLAKMDRKYLHKLMAKHGVDITAKT